MPDLKSIADFIQAVGFPAAVACFLLYQVFAMDRANRATLEKQNAALASILAAIELLLHKEGLK